MGRLLCPGLLPVMPGLHLWAPWLLFIWQLLWLQIQAAQPPEASTDIIAHPEVTAAPLVLNEARFPFVAVEPGIFITSLPQKTSEPSAGAMASPYTTKCITKLKPPYQQETSALLCFEVVATALQPTTAPPKPNEVTILFPQPVQAEQSPLSAGPVPVIITEHPEVSEIIPPMPGQRAYLDLCKLCTCSNRTLSCTGLSPEQKLRSVPVPQPSLYASTITVLNLQGNSISHIDKDTWKSYHLVEKLNISGNNLQEIHKESFAGLLSLQYLDVSCNEIKFIQRSAFESLPFLKYLNLGCNLIAKVSYGTFQAWHGMQFLHKLILNGNPLTTVQDPYLFNLPALKYLDIGKTQVSLTTVNKIIMKCPRLEKLILPKHLACCLCQFKIHIEAITETVKLNCENQCLANAACDEKLLIEGPFMKVINGRRNNNTELTIQPEVAQAMENVDRSGNFINLLMKLLREQQEVKVSKSEWDTPQWDTEQMNERTEGQGEQELQEPSELAKEEPGPEHINKLLIASPVIAVAAFFFVIFCFFLVCTGSKPRGSDESSLDQKKTRSLWKRLLFSLKSMFESLAAYIGKSVQDSSEESSYKSEGSVSVTATTRTYAEETPMEGGQENEA